MECLFITVVAQSTQCGTNILRKKNTNVKLVDNITADIQKAQHDNVCLTQRTAVTCTLFYLITLKMQIMTMCTSREELQFYFVHLYFTTQGEDHTPFNCGNHDNVCLNTQELQFYSAFLFH
jgi:hypothetical protein